MWTDHSRLWLCFHVPSPLLCLLSLVKYLPLDLGSTWGCPGGLDSKEIACNTGDPGLIPGGVKIPWRRKWQPTPVFLPGESHGQRSLVGYSPWGCKELDRTESLPLIYILTWGFPGGSDGKKSACNAVDLGLIPGLGGSPAKGNGNHSILAWRIP